MKKVNCVIVDDEPLALELIRDFIARVPQLHLLTSCKNAMEAFAVLNEENVDLLFLDIEMPDMNGIEFLKSLSNPPAVILTTAYREYALSSYEVDVIDYLLKPIAFERFFKAITKFLKTSAVDSDSGMKSESDPEQKGFIYVYADKKNVKVFLEDIRYVESIKDYVRIHTDSKNLVSKDTISRYEHLLPPYFLRIHRSFIVNTRHLTAFTQQDVEIGTKEIPIGISYKKNVLEKLKGSGS